MQIQYQFRGQSLRDTSYNDVYLRVDLVHTVMTVECLNLLLHMRLHVLNFAYFMNEFIWGFKIVVKFRKKKKKNVSNCTQFTQIDYLFFSLASTCTCNNNLAPSIIE